jgi:CBS domain-containing protein
MVIIAQILDRKGTQVHTIAAESTLHEAAQAMAENAESALLVRSNDGKNVGILSERDIVLHLATSNGDVYNKPVWRAMHEVHEIDAEQDVQCALNLMVNRRVRHLIVRRDGHIAGIVSIGDLVKVRIDEQEGSISSLCHYITGMPD